MRGSPAGGAEFVGGDLFRGGRRGAVLVVGSVALLLDLCQKLVDGGRGWINWRDLLVGV